MIWAVSIVGGLVVAMLAALHTVLDRISKTMELIAYHWGQYMSQEDAKPEEPTVVLKDRW